MFFLYILIYVFGRFIRIVLQKNTVNLQFVCIKSEYLHLKIRVFYFKTLFIYLFLYLARKVYIMIYIHLY